MTTVTIATTITFKRESLMACWEEGLAMARREWDAMPHQRGTPPFDPDKDQFELLERTNMARLYTCRDGGRLVGYACLFVFGSPWHKGYREAAQHFVYLDPAYRKPNVIRGLFRFFEEDLRAAGVLKVQGHAAPGRKGGRLLQRLGYRFDHDVYTKILLEDVCQP